MPDNEKERERSELHEVIWAIADDLRGSVDGWEFKQYIVVMLFYRFISEKLTNYINSEEHAAGNQDFNYANISDEKAEPIRDGIVRNKGFFILPSQLFENVHKNAVNDENLNETIEKVFWAIGGSSYLAQPHKTGCHEFQSYHCQQESNDYSNHDGKGYRRGACTSQTGRKHNGGIRKWIR